jgi:hypothetical protein
MNPSLSWSSTRRLRLCFLTDFYDQKNGCSRTGHFQASTSQKSTTKLRFAIFNKSMQNRTNLDDEKVMDVGARQHTKAANITCSNLFSSLNVNLYRPICCKLLGHASALIICKIVLCSTLQIDVPCFLCSARIIWNAYGHVVIEIKSKICHEKWHNTLSQSIGLECNRNEQRIMKLWIGGRLKAAAFCIKWIAQKHLLCSICNNLCGKSYTVTYCKTQSWLIGEPDWVSSLTSKNSSRSAITYILSKKISKRRQIGQTDYGRIADASWRIFCKVQIDFTFSHPFTLSNVSIAPTAVQSMEEAAAISRSLQTDVFLRSLTWWLQSYIMSSTSRYYSNFPREESAELNCDLNLIFRRMSMMLPNEPIAIMELYSNNTTLFSHGLLRSESRPFKNHSSTTSIEFRIFNQTAFFRLVRSDIEFNNNWLNQRWTSKIYKESLLPFSHVTCNYATFLSAQSAF